MKTKLTILTALILLLTGFNSHSQTCRPDSAINYSYVLGSIVKEPSTKIFYYYDGAGNNIKEQLFRWNDSINDWEYWRINDKTFNGAGKLTEQIDKFWDAATQTWVAPYRTALQYNGTGSVSQQLHQIRNSATNVWINDYKVDVAFNSANDTLQELRQNWENNTWKNNYKIDYTYNLDTLTMRELKLWDDVTPTWKNQWKEEYTYNTAGLLEKTTLNRAYSSGNYYFSTQFTNTYNSTGKLAETLREEWDQAADYWITPYKYTYEYNSINCITVSNVFSGRGNRPSNGFNPYSQVEYFYGGVANAISENDITTFNCFPVPATNYLTISTAEQINWSELSIVNTMGQLMPIEYLSNGATSKTINVQGYAKGIYFLQVKNATRRFVKQ